MFFRPALSERALVEICHRQSVSLAAGIDVRKVWQREVDSAPAAWRPAIQQVQQAILRGESLAEALRRSDPMFPPLVHEMVAVGDRTGQLAEVFSQLEKHYHTQLALSRMFWRLVAWPFVQLVLAVIIVGLVILISGLISGPRGGTDVLGLGLVGVTGLIIYGVVVAAIATVIIALYRAVRSGALWVAPLQRFVTGFWGIGPAIQKLCLARIAWALHLGLNVDLDLRRLVPMVLSASGNHYYTQHQRQMIADITAGKSLYETFLRTHAYPEQFLDALQVAEESGQISESMARLTKVYEQEAEGAMRTIVGIVAGLIWLAVVAVIVVAIFRMFFLVYLGPMYEALEMTK